MPSPHISPRDGSDLESWFVGNHELGARFDAEGRRRVGTTPVPTIAVGAGAGSGSPAVAIAGTDEHGSVTVTLGTSPTTGTLATVTFNEPYASAPVVCVTPKDVASAAAKIYATATTTTLVILAAAAASGGPLHVDYVVVGGI
jgi:hypothetical protein